VDADRIAAAREVRGKRAERRESRQGARRALQVYEIGNGEADLLCAGRPSFGKGIGQTRHVLRIDQHDRIGFSKRVRAEQYGIHDAVNHDPCAHGQGQDHARADREKRSPPQQAPGQTKFLKQQRHKAPSTRSDQRYEMIHASRRSGPRRSEPIGQSPQQAQRSRRPHGTESQGAVRSQDPGDRRRRKCTARRRAGAAE
jgi:hypothetical protein